MDLRHGPQGASSASNPSRRYDADFGWRFAIAFVSMAAAAVCFLSIVGFPLGLVILRFGLKPLKDFFVDQELAIAAKIEAAENLRRRIARDQREAIKRNKENN